MDGPAQTDRAGAWRFAPLGGVVCRVWMGARDNGSVERPILAAQHRAEPETDRTVYRMARASIQAAVSARSMAGSTLEL